RVLGQLLLRRRDGRPAVAEQVEIVEELREPARAGADTEERERRGEEHGEDEIHRLRPPPHADEEELLVRVTAAGMLPPPARLRLGRGLCLRLLCLLRLDRRACHQRLRVPRPRPLAMGPAEPRPARAVFARRARTARSSPRRAPTSATARGTSSPGRDREARAPPRR